LALDLVAVEISLLRGFCAYHFVVIAECVRLGGLGLVLHVLNRHGHLPNAAARHYRQAAVLFARNRDPEHSVMADIGLGDALSAQADFAEAARIYRVHMRVRPRGRPINQREEKT
jgi:hypothetical protein